MEDVVSRRGVAGFVVALLLAGGAVVLFALSAALDALAPAAESAFAMTWILAWTAVVWAAIVATASVYTRCRRIVDARRRSPV